MTISMPDSTRVADLPAGYPAYLGYPDGDEPTADDLAARFPHAERVILTVTGGTLACTGIDIEPGNPTAAAGALWVKRKLKADPRSLPVIYASVEGEPGYGMHEVIDNLASLGIPLSSVRLLSAHYGKGAHICGPHSCELIPVDMDGTQWTDKFLAAYPGAPVVDMSLLAPDFFTRTTTSATEKIVQELPVVRQGDTGNAVRTVQALCNAREKDDGPAKVALLVLDGVFGQQTEAAVKWNQNRAGIPVDGVVGPQTWPVLLGIA